MLLINVIFNLFSVFNIDGSVQTMEIKNDVTDKRRSGLSYSYKACHKTLKTVKGLSQNFKISHKACHKTLKTVKRPITKL